MSLVPELPSFRPEDREAREAYDQHQCDKLMRLCIDRDNARIKAEKERDVAVVQLAAVEKERDRAHRVIAELRVTADAITTGGTPCPGALLHARINDAERRAEGL